MKNRIIKWTYRIVVSGLFLIGLCSPLMGQESLQDLFSEHLTMVTQDVYSLFDTRFAPAAEWRENIVYLDDEMAEELFDAVASYLQANDQPHPHLVDAQRFGRSAFAEGAFRIGRFPATGPFADLFPVVFPKFSPDDPDAVPTLALPERAFDDEGMVHEIAVPLFSNVLKQFYDARHNSIHQFINGRNISEEFLYFRDAFIVQNSVTDYYFDQLIGSDRKKLDGPELFLADSHFRDQLSGFFMLGFGIDQRMIKFLDDRFLQLLAQPSSIESFVDGLINMLDGAVDNAPDKPTEFDLGIYRNQVATVWMFQGWYLSLLPSRLPVYAAPEAIQEKLAQLLLKWKAMRADVVANEEMLIDMRQKFASRFTDQPGNEVPANE